VSGCLFYLVVSTLCISRLEKISIYPLWYSFTIFVVESISRFTWYPWHTNSRWSTTDFCMEQKACKQSNWDGHEGQWLFREMPCKFSYTTMATIYSSEMAAYLYLLWTYNPILYLLPTLHAVEKESSW
jgi:hypothetical protein